MSEFWRQFDDRIGRAVSKFLLHAEGEGLDTAELNGVVLLTFVDGRLTGIEHSPVAVVDAGMSTSLVTISEPVAKRRATTAEVQAELEALDAGGFTVVDLNTLWPPKDDAKTEDDGHG